mgnify:CR=1 FL=1
MIDIRLEEIPFEFDGKTYKMRCNMNVLADVQEACGGNIGDALRSGNTLKSVLLFAAAMLNDYADEQGWPERFTAKQLGRKLGVPTANLRLPDGLAIPKLGVYACAARARRRNAPSTAKPECITLSLGEMISPTAEGGGWAWNRKWRALARNRLECSPSGDARGLGNSAAQAFKIPA